MRSTLASRQQGFCRAFPAAVGLLMAIACLTPAKAGEERFGHVEKVGTAGPPLILVPCLGCDWRSFDEVMERNKNRYRMYAVSWPGMGKSALPELSRRHKGSEWNYIIDALRNLILEEGLEKPVLLGHSAAGPYVIQFAAEYPDLVGKIISVDAVITNGDTWGYTQAQRDAWAEEEMKSVHQSFPTDEAWREFNIKAAASLGRRSQFYIDMWLTPPKEHVFAYWDDWLKCDAGAMLPRLQVPLMSMHAVSAKASDPQALRRDLYERVIYNGAPPGMRLEFIDAAGHTIWEYQPQTFDQLVAEFIEGPAGD